MPHSTHGIVHIADLIADDDLILTALLDDRSDAIGLFQNFCLCLALIIQRETQSGDAVGQRDNVVFSADILDDDAGKTIVLTCHNRVLLFFLDLFQIGERNPAFPLPAALELFLVSL